MDIAKRSYSFFNSHPANASERVRIILSNNADAGKLADAIRSVRKSSDSDGVIFEVEKSTAAKLKEAS
ncbi:MAG: hypothetical protein AAGA85_10910 [Bacteroidota bacterium]